MQSRLAAIARTLPPPTSSLSSTTSLRTMSTTQKIRVAILDDYQGFGASKFSHLSSRVDVSDFPDTLSPSDKATLISRLKDATIVCTMRERTPLPADVIEALPNLKLICTTGLRNASIDMTAAAKQGIPVTGATGSGRSDAPAAVKVPMMFDSTVQQTWALILGIAKNVARDDASVKSGGWQITASTGLAGKTLSMLGLGKLGAATARIAVLGFGMKINAWSTNLTQEKADESANELGLPAGTFHVVGSKLELFRTADVLSVHYVLSDRSRNIVGAKELEAMKPTALLVNTSRGPLINEDALLTALKSGKIRGVALDVYNIEPLPKDSEWRTTPWGKDGRSEVLLSPHMGYVEESKMHAWYEETAENVERYLEGKELRHKIN